MSKFEIKKITLKGHSSFYLREGWLSKGLEVNDAEVFRDTLKGTETLGVGSAMVKAIRYYLTAANLKKNQTLQNTDFGNLVLKYDPYFEYIDTKYLLHFYMVINDKKATSWYLFFNYCNYDGMTKEEASNHINDILHEANPAASFSRKSLDDDITCILNTYVAKSFTHDMTPEDNYISPLSELELLEVDSNQRLVKCVPRYERLSALVVLYVMLESIEQYDNNSNAEFIYQTSVDRLMNDENNIGKVFNLNRTVIYEYLGELQALGYLVIHKTAGLDQVYIKKDIALEEIFKTLDTGEQ